MNLTNDQYKALNKLEKWYRKYNHQIIEISGVIGTGSWELVQEFIELAEFDAREVMYLSYDQKQVLELAYRRFHAYYINNIIYNYNRILNFDTLPVINPHSNNISYKWEKSVKSKIDPKYKLMVVFDSTLMNERTLVDLCSFGLPIILLRDPMLIPSPDTYTFMRDPNIELEDIHPDYAGNPIVYFAHKILNGERLKLGNYDNVSIIAKKQMNLYNLRSSNMNICMSDEVRNQINSIYRSKILKQKSCINISGERVIVMEDMYHHYLVNKDEKRIKVFLTRGVVGNISRINRHAINTKYVPIEFTTEFYHEVFDDLVLDRHYLNKINAPCRQIIPDEVVRMEYAYALTPSLARLSHWDKVTLIMDKNEQLDPELQTKLIYTAITRARNSLTILI